MEQQPVETRSWAVTKDDVPHQLALNAEGLTLRETDGEGFVHYPLSELREASFPTPMSVELLTDAGVVALAFHAGAVQRELRAALEELAVTVRTPPSRTEELLTTFDDTPPPRRTKYVDGFGFLTVGLCVLVVGAFFFLLASNSAEGESGSGTTIGFVFAWLVLTLGSLLASIGVVGIGVTIGIRRAVDLMGPPSSWGQRR
ncbi:hypothetical protein [Nocardioides sp. 503]|uniref:hypothetical protein n=1 Tax=Nocardioides sp. 503 TaxID=2508326 RepID=UPI00106F53D3|nr:hypothetical protein [Nocardioides sp. 503]